MARLRQQTVISILLAHAGLVWAAMALRVDQFPLTWAPMYANHGGREGRDAAVHRVILKDKPYLEDKGWRGTRRDGGAEWIPRGDVNVPMRSMWRLFYLRTWGRPPPKERQKNSGGWTLDRWVWGLPSAAPLSTVDWRRRLLVSVNRTLERAPDDPAFVVRLAAQRSVLRFDRDTNAPLGRVEERAEIVWDEAWRVDFDG